MEAYSLTEFIILVAVLLILLAYNLYVIFKNEKTIFALLWAAFVIGVPVIGTAIYSLFFIIREFATTKPKDVIA